MGRRYVVIGSNSFSGSHLIRELLQSGNDVLGLSRSEEVAMVFRPYSWDAAPTLWEFKRLNVSDTRALRFTLEDFKPQVVVNFAAQSMVAQSWERPEHWYQTNVVALACLVQVLEGLPSLG